MRVHFSSFKWRRNSAEKILTAWVGRTNVTDDRQTGRRHADGRTDDDKI